ncbi:MAG: amylo-alpha-1,6-glucosidase [Chloroflexota bacterium]|nr:amylo-alpha-1,6-glucosidase [Chloroflexota bacterium]
MAIRFGRDICGDYQSATAREWLVTNGSGGYASGTISGALTRRYHGLLVAALQPPVARTLLVAKLDESARYRGVDHRLYVNAWGSGAINPDGNTRIESFALEGAIPTWTFAFGDALLEKRVWMEQGANTTYIRYTLTRATAPVVLFARALVNHRDAHANTVGRGSYAVESVRRGLCITAPDRESFYILSDRADASPVFEWYRDFALAIETERGLPDRDDHAYVGDLAIALSQGESVTFAATTVYADFIDGAEALARCQTHEARVIKAIALGAITDDLRQLALAADQFIVARPLADVPDGRTVIAGYPWFTDWGRDTMIALPGLTLTTGRHADAALILRTFARFVDQGMLPNTFPDAGAAPGYNTVDATLWYIEAIRAYHAATADLSLIRDLYPVLTMIIDAHMGGTRYGIAVDPADGLLRAGEPGVQLTWMDVKIDDWVVTPRTGKAVEINALWYNALNCMAEFAHLLGASGDRLAYTGSCDRVRASFQRFWNEDAHYLHDVIDTPDGTSDATIRPNAIFAVSLFYCGDLLTEAQALAVVDECAASLVTSHGLRSLHPGHPNYRGVYVGDGKTRDAMYHQGAVWGWLIGAFVEAHLNTYNDKRAARSFLLPLIDHLSAGLLGSAAEIFDGDPPHAPRGAAAQAWTVAELLRGWALTQ